MACSRASPSMHGSTARVHQCEPTPIHAWLAHTRLHPCMAGRRTCINASPPPSHAWLARARVHPCMARRRVCINASPPPSMHGLRAHVSIHAWLDSALASMRAHPLAMHGLLTHVSIHAWLDSACASMRAHPQPCMACAHTSPSMHGWAAHLHQCEPTPLAMHGLLARVSIHAWLDGACASMRAHPHPCMACAHTYPSMHGWTAHLHRCEPTPQPCMACSRASPSMHGST